MTKLSSLEAKIGITFKNKQLLENAFIHRSYINEHKDSDRATNEKLEFLGDSVLSLITSVYLFKNYPSFHEGQYTDIKASIVRTESLAKAAHDLTLGQFLYLSRGEEDSGGRSNNSILADCFEALLAVIFIDRGYITAQKFVERFLFKDILAHIIASKTYIPSKNLLQEYWQEKYKNLPRYEIVSEEGPQHDKIYTVAVYDGTRKIGEGIGKSKKRAEEQAASMALKKLSLVI